MGFTAAELAEMARADAEIEAISCIEAFSTGLVPVISDSPKSATHQFALDERSRFAAGDCDDLARKIDYWIEHDREREEMGRRYSEYGRQFQIGNCVSQIEDMFRTAIREQSAVGHMESSDTAESDAGVSV